MVQFWSHDSLDNKYSNLLFIHFSPIMPFHWLTRRKRNKNVVHLLFWFLNDFSLLSPDKRRASCQGYYQPNCFLNISVDCCALHSILCTPKKVYLQYLLNCVANTVNIRHTFSHLKSKLSCCETHLFYKLTCKI